MLVKDIMAKNFTSVQTKTSVFDAIKLLLKSKENVLVVLDARKSVLGMVNDKDLLVSLDFLGAKKAKDVCVGEVMSKELISLSTDSSVEEAVQILVRDNVSSIPVSEDNNVVGLITRRDVLKKHME
ncbi:MAG: CBS domain-containing protein [Candidatus Omnitrophota bacterium]